MATSSKKAKPQSSTSTAPAKWPFAKKVITATPAIKASAKNTAATPSKKTVAVATKKAASTPVKKVAAPKAKKPVSKPVTTAKSAPKKSIRKNTVTFEERYNMIATAAYFLAERHGFNSCYAMRDWIAAEAEIDAMHSV